MNMLMVMCKKILEALNITIEDLDMIVREDEKQRYSYNGDHTRIRANQGHSIPVNVDLKEVQPPDILYHGTATRFVPSILEKGILSQTRGYKFYLSGPLIPGSFLCGWHNSV